MNQYLDITLFQNHSLNENCMKDYNDVLFQAVEEVEQVELNKSEEAANLYHLKSKTNDFYDSNLSTLHQSLLFSELYAVNEFDNNIFQVLEIQSSEPEVKKRGRPRKSQARKSDEEYSGQHDEDSDFQITLNKNKKRRKKGTLKLKSKAKNIYFFLLRIIYSYLRKHYDEKELKQITKIQANATEFIRLLQNQKFYKGLREMFQTRHLNREIVLSRVATEVKFIYLKKIEHFRDIFMKHKNIDE